MGRDMYLGKDGTSQREAGDFFMIGRLQRKTTPCYEKGQRMFDVPLRNLSRGTSLLSRRSIHLLSCSLLLAEEGWVGGSETSQRYILALLSFALCYPLLLVKREEKKARPSDCVLAEYAARSPRRKQPPHLLVSCSLQPPVFFFLSRRKPSPWLLFPPADADWSVECASFSIRPLSFFIAFLLLLPFLRYHLLLRLFFFLIFFIFLEAFLDKTPAVLPKKFSHPWIMP